MPSVAIFGEVIDSLIPLVQRIRDASCESARHGTAAALANRDAMRRWRNRRVVWLDPEDLFLDSEVPRYDPRPGETEAERRERERRRRETLANNPDFFGGD